MVQEAFGKKAIAVDVPTRKLSDCFGELVFNREKMRKYLDAQTFDCICNCIDNGVALDGATAQKAADGMKTWRCCASNLPSVRPQGEHGILVPGLGTGILPHR